MDRAGVENEFASPYVHLGFGARQTGKTMSLPESLPGTTVWLDPSRPAERAEYQRGPDRLIPHCRALPRSRCPAAVVVDEPQNVPRIFDAVQHLCDSDKGDRSALVLPVRMRDGGSEPQVKQPAGVWTTESMKRAG